jgi:hypothetical protein
MYRCVQNDVGRLIVPCKASQPSAIGGASKGQPEGATTTISRHNWGLVMKRRIAIVALSLIVAFAAAEVPSGRLR